MADAISQFAPLGEEAAPYVGAYAEHMQFLRATDPDSHYVDKPMSDLSDCILRALRLPDPLNVTHDPEAADVANAMESILCALAAVPEAWPQHIRCALMWWCLNKDLPDIESLLDKWGFNLESLQEGFALALCALRLRVKSLTTPQTPYQKLLVRLGERVVCTVSSVLEEVDGVTVAALQEDIAVCAANDALVEAIRTAQASSCHAVLAFTTQLDHHGLAQQFAQQLANSGGDLLALTPLLPLLPQALQAEFQRLTWMITGLEVVESSRRALLMP